MSGNTVVAAMNYGYDLAGDLTSASDPNSAYAFSYDGDGNVTSVDNSGTPNVPHVVLSEGYDALGDRTSLSATVAGTADFLNSYAYDHDQNLTMVQQQQQTGGNTVAPKEVDYSFNALGQFTSLAYYNELSGPRTDVATGAFTYDNDGRLTGLAYTSDGGANTIDTYGWTYNAGSLVTSFTTNEGTASYSYDPTNQLTSATYTGTNQPANESYSFDKNGNRTMTGYSTGSDNLTSSDGTYNYSYDADGNLVTRTQISNTYSTDYKTTYTWDYRNRLTDVENYDNNGVLKQHVHYVYDVFDHLIATEVDPTGGGTYTQIQHYLLDVSPELPTAGVPGTSLAQPVLVFDGSGNVIGRNLVALNAAGVDAVVAQGTVSSLTQPDTVNWDLTDNLGSLRVVLNNTSNVIDEIVYNSFGQVAYELNPTLAHFAGFEGGYVDSYTGLVNDYHRWYDSATGRWLSQDPKGFGGADADLERYALNSPTDALDPAGLMSSVHGQMAIYLTAFSRALAAQQAAINAAQAQLSALQQALLNPRNAAAIQAAQQNLSTAMAKVAQQQQAAVTAQQNLSHYAQSMAGVINAAQLGQMNAQLARATQIAPAIPNLMNAGAPLTQINPAAYSHIFQQHHNMAPLVQASGNSMVNAYNAMVQAAQQYAAKSKVVGTFSEVLNVNGVMVNITGSVTAGGKVTVNNG